MLQKSLQGMAASFYIVQSAFEPRRASDSRLLLTSQVQPMSWWLLKAGTRACLILPIGTFPHANDHAVFSKKELTLILANKEGGAHVDLNLPPINKYEALVNDSPIKTFVNGFETDSVNLARYAVAQAGIELLECIHRVFLAAPSRDN
jgi:hypothetical protein